VTRAPVVRFLIFVIHLCTHLSAPKGAIHSGREGRTRPRRNALDPPREEKHALPVEATLEVAEDQDARRERVPNSHAPESGSERRRKRGKKDFLSHSTPSSALCCAEPEAKPYLF
jgi:hypothetical protein